MMMLLIVTCGTGRFRPTALHFTKGKAVACGQRQAPHGGYVMLPISCVVVHTYICIGLRSKFRVKHHCRHHHRHHHHLHLRIQTPNRVRSKMHPLPTATWHIPNNLHEKPKRVCKMITVRCARNLRVVCVQVLVAQRRTFSCITAALPDSSSGSATLTQQTSTM